MHNLIYIYKKTIETIVKVKNQIKLRVIASKLSRLDQRRDLGRTE